MVNTKVESFKIIGISVRTSNHDEGLGDITGLWQKFMSEDVMAQIPNKISSEVYSIYTDYELDYTKPYTTILGCRVENLETIPEGMVGKSFEGGNYKKTIAKGDLNQGIVYQEWEKIWQAESDLNRAYTADFEVYGEKSQNPTDAEVDIFIAHLD